jgi:hypothetical protein
MMKKLQIVDDAKNAWKWFSVNIPALNLAFLGTWAVLPETFQNAIPEPVVLGISAALIVAGMVGRLVQQSKP